MHLTKLSLTNFRSFGQQTQTIDFGKVTLLFGPNSVGKSTVLLALFYVQEILGKGDCNPQYIEALGDKYVGGFKNLVNGKDLRKTIKIKLEYEKSALGSSYFDVIHLIKDGDITPESVDDEESTFDFSLMESASIEATRISVELQIGWSNRGRGSAYVKACNIDLDDIAIVTLTSDDGLNPKITGLNYLHPLLLPADHDNWLIDRFDSQDETHDEVHIDLTPELKRLNIKLAVNSKFETGAVDWRDELTTSISECEQEMALLKSEINKISDGDFKTNDEMVLLQNFQKKRDDLEDTLKHLKGEAYWADGFPLVKNDSFVSDFHTLLCARIPSTEYNNSTFMTGINVKIGDGALLHSLISFESLNGALPKLGSSLITEFEGVDRLQTKATHEIISDIVVAPLDNLLQLLKESLSIGPLRIVPDETHQFKLNPCQKDWFNGSAAWGEILNFAVSQIQEEKYARKHYGSGSAIVRIQGSSKEEFLAHLSETQIGSSLLNINHWLKKLGYELEFVGGYESVERRNVIGVEVASSEKLEKSSPKLVLKDIKSGTFLQPNEIGIGISQVFPLIVAANTVSKGFVAIEQPELHVHPRVQVDVGDLLTQITGGPNFIVETHSEHIILRLLKRIRQSNDGELPEGFVLVTPDDVSINYLNSSEDGVQITRLNIDEDGEFIERWPGGFFAERREELW